MKFADIKAARERLNDIMTTPVSVDNNPPWLCEEHSGRGPSLTLDQAIEVMQAGRPVWVSVDGYQSEKCSMLKPKSKKTRVWAVIHSYIHMSAQRPECVVRLFSKLEDAVAELNRISDTGVLCDAYAFEDEGDDAWQRMLLRQARATGIVRMEEFEI